MIPSKEKFLLGIDLGTTSVKAGLLNLATGDLESIVVRQSDEHSEYDSTNLWQRTFEVIHEAVKQIGRDNELRAVGITGQMHGAVFYDADGKIIEPLVNWRDTKRYSLSIQESINNMIGHEGEQSTGSNIASGFTGIILFWIKQNDPVLFNKIHHFILFTDFVRANLTGRNDYSTDQTNAGSTGLFNTRFNVWHSELIGKLGLPLEIFPKVKPSFEIAGVLSDEISKSLGLDKGIPVIYGGGDNQMSMLGSGVFSVKSPALLNIGTGAQVSKVSQKYLMLPGVEVRPFFDGQYALVGASLGGGGHYQKLHDELGRIEKISYIEMDALASQVPPGSEGLLYCTGPSRISPDRKQGFFGATDKLQSVGHKVRALMEGILMDLYETYSKMELESQPDLQLVGAGKALQASKTWAQITSDLFGKPLQITISENALLGAAVAAGLGTKDITSSNDYLRTIKYDNQITPNNTVKEFYSNQYINRWRLLVRSAQ